MVHEYEDSPPTPPKKIKCGQFVFNCFEMVEKLCHVHFIYMEISYSKSCCSVKSLF